MSSFLSVEHNNNEIAIKEVNQSQHASSSSFPTDKCSMDTTGAITDTEVECNGSNIKLESLQTSNHSKAIVNILTSEKSMIIKEEWIIGQSIILPAVFWETFVSKKIIYL